MSLHGFRKSKEPGFQPPVDVRTLGSIPEKENIPYPISPEIEKECTEEKLNEWIDKYTELSVQGKWLDCVVILFFLKIMAPERITTLVTLEQHKILLGILKKINFSFNPREARIEIEKYRSVHENETAFDFLAKYCYVFSKTIESILPEEAEALAEKALRALAEDINTGNDYCLLSDAVHIRIVFPKLSLDEFLEPYRLELFTAYREKLFDDVLGAAAYLRILFPEHFPELDITKDKIDTWHDMYSYQEYGFRKILARPEIPGLTTWPPKSTEPQFADNIPEQPENLNL